MDRRFLERLRELGCLDVRLIVYPENKQTHADTSDLADPAFSNISTLT
jgi:hypothetical protein